MSVLGAYDQEAKLALSSVASLWRSSEVGMRALCTG